MDDLNCAELSFIEAYKASVSPRSSNRHANWEAIVSKIEHGEATHRLPARRRFFFAATTAGVAIAAAAILFIGSVFSHSTARHGAEEDHDLASFEAQEQESAGVIVGGRPRRVAKPRIEQALLTEMQPEAPLENATEQSPVEDVAPREVPEVPEVPEAPERPRRDATQRQRAKAPVEHAAPSDPLERLRQEAALISEARTHLGDGHPAGALRAVRRYRKRFAGGALAEEAAVIEVAALCELGPEESWQRAKARFDAKFPNSPLRVHLRDDCSGT